MIDYSQFGAQVMGPSGDPTAGDELRKRRLAAQQPAGSPIAQPAGVQQPPAPTQPQRGNTGLPQGVPTSGTQPAPAPAPTQSPTFAQLQAAGIPRPAPPPIPAPTSGSITGATGAIPGAMPSLDPRANQPAPSPVAQPGYQSLPTAPAGGPPVPGASGQTRATDSRGNVTIQGDGVRTTIPASQLGNLGYDPNQVPPGWDPRAWQADNGDIQRGANIYHTGVGTPDEQVHYGYSEMVGNAAPSLAAFLDELKGTENGTQRQGYLYSNPDAYRALGALGAIPAVQSGDWDAVAKAIAGRDISGPLAGLASALGVPAATDQGGNAPLPTGAVTAGGGGAPTGGSPSGGASSPLGGSILSVLQNLLANPTAYNSDAMQREYETGARQIDDDFALRQKALNEEMARRGLYDSSVAAGNLSDLNIGRRSAQEELMNNLLMKRADSQDSGIRSALSAAMGYDSDLANRDLQGRSLGLDQSRLDEQRRQFDQSFGLDTKRFDADQQHYQDDFLRTLWELFGGGGFSQ